jgi:hypothetical protein
MRKIDRLGWTAGFAFESFGVRIGVRTTDERTLEMLTARLPPGFRRTRARVVERLYSVYAPERSAQRGVRRFQILYGNHARLARTEDLEEVLEAFESHLQMYVAEEARNRLFVHAGAVGWRGRAVVLPGRSYSGKSTLVAELVRAGAEYYSDEYAVLDEHGRVHPFTRPLSIRKEGGGKSRVSPDALEGRTGIAPLPVGLVVVSEYRQGARWRPRELSSGKGLLELLAHTVSARRQPAVALCTLSEVMVRAQVLKGARGEAREVAASILEALER